MTGKPSRVDKEILEKAMKAIAAMPATKTVKELEQQAINALREAAESVRKEHDQ